MKTVIIRAKLAHEKRTYRDIEIPQHKTLYDLAEAIIFSFDFDMDHLFGFGDDPKSYYASNKQFMCEPHEDDFFFNKEKPGDVKKTKIGEVPFFQNPRDKMSFLFDFGDDWMFELELRSFQEQEKRIRYPRILKKNGESPKQYEDYDDEE